MAHLILVRHATTQNNLGNALKALGERESGTARLEEAVAAYKAALGVFELAQTAYNTEATKANLKKTEILLQERLNPQAQLVLAQMSAKGGAADVKQAHIFLKQQPLITAITEGANIAFSQRLGDRIEDSVECAKGPDQTEKTIANLGRLDEIARET